MWLNYYIDYILISSIHSWMYDKYEGIYSILMHIYDAFVLLFKLILYESTWLRNWGY